MSQLLAESPFAKRDDAQLLAEMNEISRWHWEGCHALQRVWPSGQREARSFEEIPWLHVGLFKRLLLQTQHESLKHQRVLTSSATSQGVPSRISLDERSSQLQAQSSLAIVADSVGPALRPLIVLDDVMSLRKKGEVGARMAAAMSLKPLASQVHFVASAMDTNPQVNWQAIADIAADHQELLVYGFTWILWKAWAKQPIPDTVLELLQSKRIAFAHSGGWKKLEAIQVDSAQFGHALFERAGPGSTVVDFYGLVEQVGLLFPLCSHGFRHVPRWSKVLTRDPWTGSHNPGEVGQLQLMNPLTWGTPCHNVLTEDLAREVIGDCPCGKPGDRFELLGRIPKAEVRGCANV